MSILQKAQRVVNILLNTCKILLTISVVIFIIALCIRLANETDSSADKKSAVMQQTMDRLCAGESVNFNSDCQDIIFAPGVRDAVVRSWCKRHGITNSDEINKKICEVRDAIFNGMQVKLAKPVTANPLPAEAPAPAK